MNNGSCGNCFVCRLAGLLVIIGAINWGAIGFFNTDLVAQLLGPMTQASKIVYCIVGVAGVIKLVGVFGKCPACKKS